MGSMMNQIRAALQASNGDLQEFMNKLDQAMAKMQTAGGAGPGTGSGAGFGGGGIPPNQKEYYGMTGNEGINMPAPGPDDSTTNWLASYGGKYKEKTDSTLSWRRQLAIAGYINAAANIVGNWVIPKGNKEAQQTLQNVTSGISNVISSVGAIHSAAMIVGAVGGPVGWAAAGLITFLQIVGWGQYLGGLQEQQEQQWKQRYAQLQHDWR